MQSRDQVAIDGDKIVWRESWNDTLNPGFGGSEIVLYDLSTAEEMTLTEPELENYKGGPDVSGNRVIWKDKKTGNIHLYDIAIGSEIEIGGGAEPAIDGGKVVCVKNDGIFVYDLETGSETTIATPNNNPASPRISGDNIVWYEVDPGNSYIADVFWHNLKTGLTTRITNASNNQLYPAVDGKWIIWMGVSPPGTTLNAYNIETGITTELLRASYVMDRPEISGDIIVWTDYENDFNDLGLDIGMYSLRTKKKEIVSDLPGTEEWPDVSNDIVAWVGPYNGRSEVFVKRMNGVAVGMSSILADRTKPAVSLNAPLISTKRSKTTKFKIDWSAQDIAGIHSYTVRYRPANSSAWRDWKKNTLSMSGYFEGEPGRTYYFRVKARDVAGNIGWSKVRRTIVPYNEDWHLRDRIGFRGFHVRDSSRFYLGSIRYSLTKGNRVSYKFTGNTIGLISTKYVDRSKAKIYIDDRYVKTIDTYSPRWKPRQLVFYKKWSNKGTHKLTVVNLGTPGRARFDLDALAVGR